MFKFFIILLMSFTVVGCSKSTDDILSTVKSNPVDDLKLQVKSSIQQHFDTDEKLSKYNLHIEDLTLMESGKNQYKGWADINYNGVVHNVSVNILYDGSNMRWEIPTGDMSFITQQIIKEGLDKIDKEMTDSIDEFNSKMDEIRNESENTNEDNVESEYIEEQKIRE